VRFISIILILRTLELWGLVVKIKIAAKAPNTKFHQKVIDNNSG
jgi:hypothetical protein